MNDLKRRVWPKRISTVALGAYWMALFAATHVPRVPSLPLEPSDKLLHLSAYALLAVLLALAWSLRATFGWRQALAALAILATFAAVDEVTQIPVGRHADAVDWLADVVGSAAGLAAFLAGRKVVRRLVQTFGVGGR